MARIPPGRCCACTEREATVDRLCAACFNIIAVPCYGKVRHMRHVYAERAAAATPFPADVAFACPVCGYYHIGGTRPATSRANTAAAATTVRAIRANGHGWILTQIVEQWRYADRQDWKAHGTTAYRRRAEGPRTA